MRTIVSFLFLSSILALCLGCDPNSMAQLSQTESDTDYDFDDIVQTSPLFLCPPGKLVVGTGSDGQPLCDSHDDSSPSTVENPVYFGQSPTRQFICPGKSFLKGFNRLGRAICVGKNKDSRKNSDWTSEENLTELGHLKGQICKGRDFVIGYDELKNIICSPAWTQPSASQEPT